MVTPCVALVLDTKPIGFPLQNGGLLLVPDLFEVTESITKAMDWPWSSQWTLLASGRVLILGTMAEMSLGVAEKTGGPP